MWSLLLKVSGRLPVSQHNWAGSLSTPEMSLDFCLGCCLSPLPPDRVHLSATASLSLSQWAVRGFLSSQAWSLPAVQPWLFLSWDWVDSPQFFDQVIEHEWTRLCAVEERQHLGWGTQWNSPPPTLGVLGNLLSSPGNQEVLPQPLRQRTQNLSPRSRLEWGQQWQQKREQSRGGVSVRVNFVQWQGHGSVYHQPRRCCFHSSLQGPVSELPIQEPAQLPSPPPLTHVIRGGSQQALSHWELAFCSTA